MDVNEELKGCERRIEVIVFFLFFFVVFFFFWGGGGGRGPVGDGVCPVGGGQDGCDRRIEVIVKMKEKSLGVR